MSSDLRQNIEALQRRLEVLEEERAILSTLYAYGHTIDYGLKAEWLDCFTEDAVYKVQIRGVMVPEVYVQQPATGFKGRDALAKFIAAHTNAPEVWHKHFLIEPVIRLEGNNKAWVESYFARLDEDENGSYISGFGRYLDQMVKSPDGKWRFKERIVEIESFAKRQ